MQKEEIAKMISGNELEEKMNKAARFLELLEEGKIRKHILPNTAQDYTYFQKQKDLENYRFFANSFALDEIMKCEVTLYNGDEQI